MGQLVLQTEDRQQVSSAFWPENTGSGFSSTASSPLKETLWEDSCREFWFYNSRKFLPTNRTSHSNQHCATPRTHLNVLITSLDGPLQTRQTNTESMKSSVFGQESNQRPEVSDRLTGWPLWFLWRCFRGADAWRKRGSLFCLQKEPQQKANPRTFYMILVNVFHRSLPITTRITERHSILETSGYSGKKSPSSSYSMEKTKQTNVLTCKKEFQGFVQLVCLLQLFVNIQEWLNRG